MKLITQHLRHSLSTTEYDSLATNLGH